MVCQFLFSADFFFIAAGEGLPSLLRPEPFISMQPSREEIYKELENVKVSTFQSFISKVLHPYLLFRAKTFSTRQISTYLTKWAELTSDPYIIRIVSGDLIEFDQSPKTQHRYLGNSISHQHISLIKQEISSSISKNVLKQCAHEDWDLISPIFCVPKKDGNLCLIANLN